MVVNFCGCYRCNPQPYRDTDALNVSKTLVARTP